MTKNRIYDGMKLPLYFDYASTTPVDPRVADVMVQCLTAEGNFGNPAARSHFFGWKAEEAVETARQHVADLINADSREIVWTSGATESNNLALKGFAHANRDRGQHIITSKIEHKAVLDTVEQLQLESFDITYLDPDGDGLIKPQQVADAIAENTVMVSLMHVNNEIGVINDIAAIGDICRQHSVCFHVDAAQSSNKLPIDVDAMKVDMMSFSAHKSYGPKGVGALYVRRRPRVRLQAQIHGGGHERGMRSGTLATHQIVGMGEAFRLAKLELQHDYDRAVLLRHRFLDGLKDMEAVYINGSMEQRVPHNINVGFDFVNGESLMTSLQDIAVSSGSACTSASLEPSYVLRALGVSDALAHSSLRFGFGRSTTIADVDYALTNIRETVNKLRELSPLWASYKASTPKTH